MDKRCVGVKAARVRRREGDKKGALQKETERERERQTARELGRSYEPPKVRHGRLSLDFMNLRLVESHVLTHSIALAFKNFGSVY